MLELKNITKVYEAGTTQVEALKGINIAFRENEFVAILGQSGCGKTTLLNIIGGLDRYTSGDLIINGRSTKEYDDRDWDTYRNHSIGFVFQSYNLFANKTALKNVTEGLIVGRKMPKEQAREIAMKALEKVGLADRSDAYPAQLSGGQQQRVAIARAVVSGPKIILADEPTGNLDSKNGQEVMELLTELNKEGTTIVMVTHSQRDAGFASRVINLFDGQIVASIAEM